MPRRLRDYISVPQAHRETGVGRRALERAINAEELPIYVFDSWRRIRRADLTAWLERHRRPARGAGEEGEP
jgi:excisionase family DNA binding protein